MKSDYEQGYDTAMYRATEIQSARRERAERAEAELAAQWHPASEPPEIGDPKSYLVCVRGDGYAIARYTPYDTQDNRDWLSDAYGFLEITHWRELPAPPEVEE